MRNTNTVLKAFIAAIIFSAFILGTAYFINNNPKQEQPKKQKERFFYVAYDFAFVNSEERGYGALWFGYADRFPSKKSIDSIIYAGLPYERSCYQPVVIKNIFEFNNEQDYISFDSGYVGTLDTTLAKKSCTLK